MIEMNFRVDELDHQGIHHNYYIQNVKVDYNDYKVALLAILVHIFYMNQFSYILTYCKLIYLLYL
jgi:hypothetical protein